MKFLVVGAGGTGGTIAACLGRAGQDVTLIARGAHLEAIRRNGLILRTEHLQGGDVSEERIDGVHAVDSEEYLQEGYCPDVVFVCTKSYSIEEIAPFLNRAASPDTVIIPILNGIRMGAYIREYVTAGQMIDGCIYVNAFREEPGCIRMKGELLRIVFGSESDFPEEQGSAIERILNDSGIRAIYSHHILRDTFRKFSYVSPAGAAGLYYDVKCDAIQQEGEIRNTFIALIREVIALANAMGVEFEQDLVPVNLNILDHLLPGTDTSLQRDIAEGRKNELSTLIGAPIRLGREYGVPMTQYRKVADKIGFAY